MNGVLLVISGPSGAGKSSLIKELLSSVPDSIFSISTTTRGVRAGEKEGVNYYYVSKEEFEEGIKQEIFLEWAKVHENYYGTSLRPIVEFLKEGKVVILDIDVQGHKIAMEKFHKFITSVFVTTSSHTILKQRLIDRKTDSKEIIEKRLNSAVLEMAHMNDYDYIIINDDFKEATKEIVSIASVAKNRTKKLDLEKFISKWLES
ncbi:MAG: guanylate kinase [Campylobacteraceae bacterium]|jgi:guanylate kinase|nr:guanylate kinase [Campylobacteraceae bacterium]